MIVTKMGTPRYNRKWVGKCISCGSEAEALEAEMTNIIPGSIKESKLFAWEICPVCSSSGSRGMLFYPKDS